MELRIRDVSRTSPNGVQLLSHVSLTIAHGMFGLLGPKGAGKSTLMRILATLQEPDEGSVTLDGVDAVRQKDEVRKTLGYLPQEFQLFPRASAENLLDYFALMKGIIERRARREVVEALLQHTSRRRFGNAVALLGNPRLMLVDEPTTGLDPVERVRFLNVLSALGENRIVIIATDRVEDVSEFCPRLAVIDRGEIQQLSAGSPSRLPFLVN